jgi:hypothetical protein
VYGFKTERRAKENLISKFYIGQRWEKLERLLYDKVFVLWWNLVLLHP